MPKVTFDKNHSTALVQGHGYTAIAVLNSSMSMPQGTAKTPPTAPKVELEDKMGDVALWGPDNLFPQNVLKDAKKTTLVYPIIDWRVRALYSGGLEIVLQEYDDDGKEKIIYKDKSLDAFRGLAMNANFNRYAMEACSDFYWFYNAFPELILSKDRKTIANIQRQRATWSRWKIREKGELISSKCFINPNWDTKHDQSSAIQVDTIDPYNFPVETLRDKSFYKFIYPLSYPDPENSFYSLAPWNCFRTSKWFDFASKIAEFKDALLKNQITLRYHISFHTDFWSWKYPQDWEKWDYKVRMEKIKETLTDFDDNLKGHVNAGKTLISHRKSNVMRPGEDLELVKIERLDDKLQTNMYIEDSSEASSHALFAMGVHPTLLGHAPGTTKTAIGAGSGSDQRVAWNNYLDMCNVERDLVLEPLHFIRDYNGYDSRIRVRFKSNRQQITDVNKEPQQMAN